MHGNNSYIKFSSFLDEKHYFTQIDLTLDRINISREGVLMESCSIADFKEKVNNDNTLSNRVYESILSNAEQLIEILSRA